MSNVPKQEGIWEELKALKTLTESAGVIHEAQKFQLQMWGPIAMPHAREIEIGVALPWTKDEGKPTEKHFDVRCVEFRALGVDKRKAPPQLMKRLRVLDSWVKRLLGDRFAIKVKVDGALIYESRGKPKEKQKLHGRPSK